MSEFRGTKESGFLACISASSTAITSLLRSFPLLFSSRPKTPLRVLCIVAFDSLHVFRNSKRLPADKLRTLASLLDCGACVNAFFDGKGFCRREYKTTRRLLQNAGIGEVVQDYLRRLNELERGRPSTRGDNNRHAVVRSYREMIVRLSLGMVTATAFDTPSLEDGIQAVQCDQDLDILFRIVMQCQIIDDILDLDEDNSGELPSFLTSPASLPEALQMTRAAANDYGDGRDLPLGGNAFPFRVALFAVSIFAKLMIGWKRWQQSGASCQDRSRYLKAR